MLNKNFSFKKYSVKNCFSSRSLFSTSNRGRLTQSHIRSIKKYFSLFCLNFKLEYINFIEIFHRKAPIILEVGFGSGENLINMALNFPEKNFLGIEVYWPGIAICLKQAYLMNIKNLKIICYNAVDVIKNMISTNQLNQIQLFFPDPWPKRKHQKRRILKTEFAILISDKLINRGFLNILTDFDSYAVNIINIMEKIDLFVNCSNSLDHSYMKEFRIVSKFEKKAKLSGNKIFDLLFQCIK